MIAVVDYGVGNLYSASPARLQTYRRAVHRSPARQTRCARRTASFCRAWAPLATRRQSCAPAGLDAAAARPCRTGQAAAWASALACSFSLTKAMNTASTQGLGLIPGRGGGPSRDDLAARTLKVPHMGWNSLHLNRPEDPLLAGVREGDFVYYVHSLLRNGLRRGALAASSDYGGVTVAGAVGAGSVCGTPVPPGKERRGWACASCGPSRSWKRRMRHADLSGDRPAGRPAWCA